MKRGAPLATPSNRTCGQCEKQYTHLPKWKFGRFCSSICHGQSLRIEKACEQCGAMFLGCKRQRFCGKECVYKSHTTPNHTCAVCGIEFAHKHANGGKNVCCSRECGFKYIRQQANIGKSCYCEWKHCINCNKPFQARTPKAVTCCKVEKPEKQPRKCKDCGITVASFKHYCGVCAHLRTKTKAKAFRKANRRTLKARRRAKKKSVVNAPVSLKAIVRAHGSICHICGVQVLIGVKGGPMMPTMDHVVPLALGGWHDLLNLRVAHFICNSRKSDKYSGQLMLTYNAEGVFFETRRAVL